MNKQEILEEIEKTKVSLLNIIKMFISREQKRWKPKQYGLYWFVDDGNKVQCDFWQEFKSINSRRYTAYNCFKTQKEAEQEAEKILVRRMLEDIARRLNKGKKIDWNNEQQEKYFICCNKTGFNVGYNLEESWGTVYCLDKNFKDVAIQEIGEERLKKYLRSY